MSTEKEDRWINKVLIATAISFFVISPLMKKYGNKLYKSWLEQDETDLESKGPEIVKKKETKEK